MTTEHGLFIGIEGGDGSGKATQAGEVAERAKEKGYDVLRISFPQYGEPSALFAGRYLDGKYGGVNDVHPELASLAYAIDRFAAGSLIRAHLEKRSSLVIADRYVASNLAHQGTKLSDDTERHQFYSDILQLEYETLGLPKPDVNIVLLVPSSVAQLNVDKKDTRTYTTKKRDIHEADADHLEKAKANYEELCRLFPEEFTPVACMASEGVMRSIPDITGDIWNLVDARLKKG